MKSLSDATLDHLRAVVDRPDLAGTRYEVVEPIASGGMGTVYRARDRELEREVALKVVRGPAPEGPMAERLRQEARTLARLEHPGLVPVHDVGTLPDGRPYYVMRLVRGVRLDEHLRGAVSQAERLRLFLRICEPVAFAHAQGIVHRDLKPANIMVGPYGEVLVLDWGIAKVLGAASGDQGMGLGTHGFMAPEQASADGALAPVDQRADVYALGAILGEMWRGMETPPARPIAAIRAQAMAEAPDARYARVTDLAADVSRFLDGLRVTAYRESPLERVGRLAKRHRTAIGLVAAYLLMRMALLLFGPR